MLVAVNLVGAGNLHFKAPDPQDSDSRRSRPMFPDPIDKQVGFYPDQISPPPSTPCRTHPLSRSQSSPG